MIWSWLHRNPRIVDLSLVAVLVLLGIGAAARNGDHQTAAVALAACESLPLLARRRFPAAVTLVVSAVALVTIAFGAWLLPLPLGVALYTLTSIRTSRRDRTVAAAAIVAVAVGV